jgi:hypothetical protein
MRYLILIVLLAGCGAPGMERASDAQVCQALPDPVPCIRVGTALAGDVAWLLEALDDGADATELETIMEQLRGDVPAWEECSDELMDTLAH